MPSARGSSARGSSQKRVELLQYGQRLHEEGTAEEDSAPEEQEAANPPAAKEKLADRSVENALAKSNDRAVTNCNAT